ncbi:hypothetical protein BH24BAC1_BH24BAC1_02310 [soil metagenome]
MDTSLYLLTAAGFIGLSFVCLVLIFYGLRQGLRATVFSQGRQNRIFYGSLLAVSLWILIISILAGQGFFADFTGMPPRMAVVVLPFVVVLGLTFTRTPTTILQHVPLAWLHYLQGFRVPVEVLLWMLFIQNLLPVQMTFEGRNFDILAGLTGPVVGYYCFARRSWPQWVAVLWNAGSLALLLNIVVISILSTPVPFRYFLNEPANTIVAHFPFILLPMVLVPVAYSMHFFSLRRLLTAEQPEGKAVSPLAA